MIHKKRIIPCWIDCDMCKKTFKERLENRRLKTLKCVYFPNKLMIAIAKVDGWQIDGENVLCPICSEIKSKGAKL